MNKDPFHHTWRLVPYTTENAWRPSDLPYREPKPESIYTFRLLESIKHMEVYGLPP